MELFQEIETMYNYSPAGRICRGRNLSIMSSAGLLACLTFAPSSAILFAQTKPLAQGTDDAVSIIKRVYQQGETDRYKLKVHIRQLDPKTSAPTLDVVIDMIIVDTVKEAKPNGVTTIVTDVERADGKFGDQETEFTAAMPQVIQTLDKQGHMIGTKTKGGNEQLASFFSQVFERIGRVQGQLYPSAPVKVGDSWKIEDTDAKDADSKLSGKATLVGKETIDGVATLKVKIVTDSVAKMVNPTKGDQLPIKIHFEGTGSLNAVTGRIIKLSGKGNGDAGDAGKNELDFERSGVTVTKGATKPSNDPKAAPSGDSPKSKAKP